MKKGYILIVIFLLFCLQNLFAEVVDSTKSKQVTAKNAVYIEFASLLLAGSISINYERVIIPHISLRAGIGNGWIYEHDDRACVQMMANYFFGNGNNTLEIGIGFGIGSMPATGAGFSSDPTPAFALGYRYQPIDGGLVFRAGGCWSYAYGFPVQISLGYAF